MISRAMAPYPNFSTIYFIIITFLTKIMRYNGTAFDVLTRASLQLLVRAIIPPFLYAAYKLKNVLFIMSEVWQPASVPISEIYDNYMYAWEYIMFNIQSCVILLEKYTKKVTDCKFY